MNSYPFLDNKMHPVSDTELGDIVPRARKSRRIDISSSPLVPASELRNKLNILLMAGELDGGLPILRNGVLVGLIPAPDLEFALDKLEDDESKTLCLMSTNATWTDDRDPEDPEPVDFTPYIDPVCCPAHTLFSFLHLYLHFFLGSRRFGYPLTYRSRLPMFRQTRPAVYVCPAGWPIFGPRT